MMPWRNAINIADLIVDCEGLYINSVHFIDFQALLWSIFHGESAHSINKFIYSVPFSSAISVSGKTI